MDGYAAKAVKYVYDSGVANKMLTLSWHAGEPMAVGLAFYEEAVELIENIVPKGNKLIHTIQTNATYINNSWCSFLIKKDFRVSVSLDGPEFLHNQHRITKSGKGTFQLVMKGVECLKRKNIPFRVITVLTKESLNYPDELYDFFENLGIVSLGFNIEEQEGANFKSSAKEEGFLANYEIFLRRIFQRQKTGNLHIREIKEKYNFILQTQKNIECTMVKPFNILSIDWCGNFFTFCPELLGISHDLYGKFILGNIETLKLEDAIKSPQFNTVYNDIKAGTNKCESECSYFFLCGGAAPANKLFENGSFNSTQTIYCKSRIQIPINIVLEDILSKEKDSH
jgi:uncharacterized protein